MSYQCPLCSQDVPKSLYEKITGIWKEKEKQMQVLKKKERALIQKEKEMKVQFQRKLKGDVERLQKNHLTQINREKEKVALQIKKEQKLFEKKLKKQLKEQLNKERGDKKRHDDEKEKKWKDKNNKIIIQYKSMQDSLKKADAKINSLEEQVKKGQTPQILGLLHEKEFLKALKHEFRNDKFKHTGKGGDIIHDIYEKKEKVGRIVYELKKVATFSNTHIEQTKKAQNMREADYGILITNGKKGKNDFVMFIQKQVIIIRPAGAIFLIKLLREHLVEISKLKLGSKEKGVKTKEILSYIQGPVFKNALNSVINDSVDLYHGLQKEVKSHIKVWKHRIGKYRDIHLNSLSVSKNVFDIPVIGKNAKKIEDKIKSIDAILLPRKIE